MGHLMDNFDNYFAFHEKCEAHDLLQLHQLDLYLMLSITHFDHFLFSLDDLCPTTCGTKEEKHARMCSVIKVQSRIYMHVRILMIVQSEGKKRDTHTQ